MVCTPTRRTRSQEAQSPNTQTRIFSALAWARRIPNGPRRVSASSVAGRGFLAGNYSATEPTVARVGSANPPPRRPVFFVSPGSGGQAHRLPNRAAVACASLGRKPQEHSPARARAAKRRHVWWCDEMESIGRATASITPTECGSALPMAPRRGSETVSAAFHLGLTPPGYHMAPLRGFKRSPRFTEHECEPVSRRPRDGYHF